ncbi:AMP-binding protein [Nocardia sp. NPDC050793]|uniref:class I adenylate-forming enzyme family protein n=1 Tax=Nocardia sp. NPDC050793 TaxID=3155159 RepID=UPI00340C8594
MILPPDQPSASDNPFLVGTADHILTIQGLDTWAETAASELLRHGVRPGHVVIADLPNSPAFAAVLRATWDIGAVFAPMNPQLTAREKNDIIALTNPQLVVAATPPMFRVSTLVWPDPFGAPDGLYWFRGNPMPEPLTSETDRLLLFTSGSTGRPKAVVLTEDNVNAGIAAVAYHFALTSEDRTLALMPWSHGHGLFATLLAPYRSGGTVVLPAVGETRRPHTLLNTVRPTWITSTPTQLAMLVSGLEHSDTTGPRLRFLRTASAPLPHAVAERAEKLLACPVAEALGLTETSHQAAANPPSWNRVLGTVGTATGTEFRLAGDIVIGGQELQVKGPAVFRAYLGDPNATAAAFTPDGWFRTLDVARWTDDGQLQLLGRLSEIVNRGGYKIAPVEVETVLCEHPEVVSALVTGLDHPHLGQELAAVVQTRSGSNVTRRDLLRHCRNSLADYKIPGELRIVTALPQLPNGKPSRRLAATLFKADARQ